MVLMPGAQEAAADEVVDFLFVRGNVARPGCGGNDGVVVTDFGVVHKALAQGALACSGGEVFAIRAGDGSDDAWQGAGDIGGQMAAVGAGVAEQLVAFVKSLRDVERMLCGETEETVGVTL